MAACTSALLLLQAVALAADAGPKPASEPGPSRVSEHTTARTADQAKTLLEKIEKGPGAERRKVVRELVEVSPTPVAFYREYLQRPRKSDDATRREILTAINADVPDQDGRFKTPGRVTRKDELEADAFDWLEPLYELAERPHLGEVTADVAVIRALAASENPEAGHVILKFAFSEVGLVYRDECGRQLRNMSPFSIPALIHGSQSKNRSIKRYATYQLERLDRQNPHKAFAAASTEALKVAVVKAFADSQYREAVYAVLDNVDHVSPQVRKAVRDAWMEYVDGRPPPEVPMRQLELPGGKLSEEEEPLWLDHRQLADVAIRKRIEELLGEAPPKDATLVEMSEQLFAHYDAARDQELDALFAAGLEKAKAGDLAAAANDFDTVLAQKPQYERRAKMAQVYFDLAAELEKEKKWEEAGRAYGKASAVAPETQLGKEALSKHYFARGKLTEAAGGDARAEFARAEELDAQSSSAEGTKWMLYAGLGIGACALVLLALGLSRRRAK